MRNLTNLGKRLLFSIGPYVVIIVCVILVAYFGITGARKQAEAEELKYIKYRLEQDSILNEYKTQLDSMQLANFLLEQELLGMDDKIDSITVEQDKLNKEYEDEINSIRNAPISDHADWFYAKLDSIRHLYGGK